MEIRVSDSLEIVAPRDWDALVGDGSPFLEYHWLRGLELTGCVDPEEGWLPQIITAWDQGRLVGAIPLYVKGNSYGEFVYDWAWANLASQLGLRYYPKLIAAVPFTPVTGQRLLVHPDLDAQTRQEVFDTLVAASLEVARQAGVSGLHFLFVTAEEAQALRQRGFLIREAYQYHWNNDGYASFEDFLGRFRSRRRNKIKREVRDFEASGITLEFLAGDEITAEHMTHVQRFYKDTCRKFGHWTSQYLKDPFFDHMLAHFTHRLQLVLARDPSGRAVAGTLSLHKGDRLYGRYWGCDEELPFLHFNACYYAPVARAIELGVKVYEPGQGGHHKFKRGFEPTLMYSAHWLANARFTQLLERHLTHERAMVEAEVEAMLADSPLKPS